MREIDLRHDRTPTFGTRLGAVAFAALALTVAGPTANSAPSRALSDLARLLEAEKTLTFTAEEVTIEYPITGPALRVRSFVTVSEGRRLEKIVETNVVPESEGSRGASRRTGPADVGAIPVHLFPDGVGDLDRIAQNYVFSPLDESSDSGWRIASRHHQGYPIEFALNDKGLWTKIAVFDNFGHLRIRRYRESITVLPSLNSDTATEIQKRGRPALAPAGGRHVDEVITADEARRRLPGVVVPTAPVLGFSVSRIEAATDGSTDSEIVFITMSDGLVNMVLAQTRVAFHSDRLDPAGSGGGDVNTPSRPRDEIEAPGGRLVVKKSSDRSDSGVTVFQWTESDGLSTLLLSSLPAGDSRRFIEELAALAPRR